MRQSTLIASYQFSNKAPIYPLLPQSSSALAKLLLALFAMVLKIFSSTVLLCLSLGSVTAVPSSWQLPITIPARLARPYLQPSSDYSAGHRGVDYFVAEGDSVYSAAAGTVLFSGHLVDRDLISITHGKNLITEMEPVCSDLKQGEDVEKGQLVGVVCPADLNYRQHCPGELCLHFSLRSEGKYLSPLTLIGGLNPSRLLPLLPKP